jgi:type I restriction enzyme S subunit
MSGGTPKRSQSEFFGGSIPWIKSGELGDGIVTTTEESITETALRESSAKLVPQGTVLIAIYGATIGKLGRVGMPFAATNQAVAALFPGEELTADYLWNVLRALREDLVRLGQGGAQPNISQSILQEIEIPVPAFVEQVQINVEIERGISVWQQLNRQVESAIMKSTALRRSTLAAAFAGLLVPQDPKDEPASMLLERIRTERKNAAPPRRKPKVGVS